MDALLGATLAVFLALGIWGMATVNYRFKVGRAQAHAILLENKCHAVLQTAEPDAYKVTRLSTAVETFCEGNFFWQRKAQVLILLEPDPERRDRVYSAIRDCCRDHAGLPGNEWLWVKIVPISEWESGNVQTVV